MDYKQQRPKLLQKSSIQLEQQLLHTSKTIGEMETMTVKDHIIDLSNDLSLQQLQTQVPQYTKTINQNVNTYVQQNSNILEESLRFKAGANQEISSIKKQLKLLEKEFETQIQLNQLTSDSANNQIKSIFGDIVQILEHLQRCEKLIKQRDRRFIASTNKQAIDLRIIKRVLQKSGLFSEYITGNTEKYMDKSKLKSQKGYQNDEMEEVQKKVKQFSIQVFTLQEQLKFVRDSLGQKSEAMKSQFEDKLKEFYNELTDQLNINKHAQDEFLQFYNQKVETQQAVLNELSQTYQSKYLNESQERSELQDAMKKLQQSTSIDLKQITHMQADQQNQIFAHKTYIQELQETHQSHNNQVAKLQKDTDKLFTMNKDYIDDFNNFVQTSQIHQLQTKIENYQNELEKYEIKMDLINAQNEHIIQLQTSSTDRINQFQIENKQLQFDQQQILNKQVLAYKDVISQLNSTRESFSMDNFNTMISTRVQHDLLPFQQNLETVKQQITIFKDQNTIYNNKFANIAAELKTVQLEIDNINDFSLSENEIVGESHKFDYKDLKEIKQHQRLQSTVLQNQRKIVEELLSNSEKQKGIHKEQVTQIQYIVQSAKKEIKFELNEMSSLKEQMLAKYKELKKIETTTQKSEQDIGSLVVDIEKCKLKIIDLEAKSGSLDQAIVQTNYIVENFVEKHNEEFTMNINDFRNTLIKQSSLLSELTHESSRLQKELLNCVQSIDDIQIFTNQAFAKIQNSGVENDEINRRINSFEENLTKCDKIIGKMDLKVDNSKKYYQTIDNSLQEIKTKINQHGIQIEVLDQYKSLKSSLLFVQDQFERVQKELNLVLRRVQLNENKIELIQQK